MIDLRFLLVSTDIGTTVLKVAANAATALGTDMKIGEQISDYSTAMDQINAQIGETQAEASRRIGQTKVEGVATLKDMGRENAYQAGVAVTEATQVGSSAENKLGASGVKRSGSPLLALQQQTDAAKAAASNKIAGGNEDIRLGGLKLGGAMADINAQASLLTAGYQRQYDVAKKKKKYLQDNRAAMVAISAAGGVVDVGESAMNMFEPGGSFYSAPSTDTTT